MIQLKKKMNTEVVSEKNILWQKTGGNDLLCGHDNVQSLFHSLSDHDQAFKLTDRHLRCVDERTPGGIHMAGSGVLNEHVVLDLKGKVDGVFAHRGCAAVLEYIKRNGISTENQDQVAENLSVTIAKQLGVPYLGMLDVEPNFHPARAVYYLGTGGFDPTRVAGLPAGFIIQRSLISDPEYAKTEAKFVIDVALSHHGFGELFTKETPFYLVAVVGKRNDVSVRTLLSELHDVAEGLDNVRIDVLSQEGFHLPHPRIPRVIQKQFFWRFFHG